MQGRGLLESVILQMKKPESSLSIGSILTTPANIQQEALPHRVFRAKKIRL